MSNDFVVFYIIIFNLKITNLIISTLKEIFIFGYFLASTKTELGTNTDNNVLILM